jgi:hypothetical protein
MGKDSEPQVGAIDAEAQPPSADKAARPAIVKSLDRNFIVCAFRTATFEPLNTAMIEYEARRGVRFKNSLALPSSQ